ncbi:MAG: flagellar hook-associated protein FlgL [Pseudomonadales bacterium]|nr:flagellar hook-associated protein FlgL [Pseudomonadales bacterium]
MRVSTNQMYLQGINAILDNQSKLSDTNLRIASGKRILKPSDDPAGAVRIHDLKNEAAGLQQRLKNIDTARGRLSYEEGVLSQVGDAMQRARELVVQGNNDALDGQNRRAIANELTSIRDQLVSLGNTRDASGEFLFSGYQTGNKPFVRSGGQVVYNGDQGDRAINIGPGSQTIVTDNGFDVFMNVTRGNGQFEAVAPSSNTGSAVVDASLSGDFVADNYQVTFIQATPADPITYEVRDSSSSLVTSGTYVEGESIAWGGVELSVTGTPDTGDVIDVAPAGKQDIFTTIQQAIDVLGGNGAGASATADLHNRMNRVLDNLDSSMGHVLDVRASIGTRMNGLDLEESLHQDSLLAFQQSLSQVEDLDLAEAINELSTRKAALEAAQLSYVQIRDLSLFNYL